jgi:hypothetical protein
VWNLWPPVWIRITSNPLHHVVAKAPWSDEVLLQQVRSQVLPSMRKQGLVVAWIVDGCGSFAFAARAQYFNRIDDVRGVPAARIRGDMDTPTGYL